jgi:hypothetical protein
MRSACGVDFNSHDGNEVQKHVRHIELAKLARMDGWSGS